MRRFAFALAGVAAALAIIASAAVCVQASTPGADERAERVRIGYVDFTRALNGVSEGMAAKKRLKSEFSERQQRLDKLQQELNAIKDSIDRDRMLLSPEALEAKEKLYRQKYQEVQQQYAVFRREMSDREAHLTEEILARMREVVRGIGEEEGYDLILEKSQDVVLYAPNARDITDRVIESYNRGGSKKGR